MRLPLKPLPRGLSLDEQRELLLHPGRNTTGYVPFEDAARCPFEHDATGPSRVNAWWLAEASWLAYVHDGDAVARIYRDATGLEAELIATGGAECCVAASDRVAVVAFRGTQPDDWSDLFDDACYAPVRWDAGHVHGGFARRLATLQAPLERALNGLATGCRVWFTGHSLGGAVATLAAYRYRDVAGGVCTFGSPRVGNAVFAGLFGEVFGERSVRYSNDHDVVTRVPPEPFALPHGLFTHVDHLRSINKDGHIGTTPPTLAHFVRDVFGRTNVLLEIIRLQQAGSLLTLPDALADHAPLYYVLHCWNDLASHAP